MRLRLWTYLLFAVALLLGGCITTETISTVSRPDLPKIRYHKIAVFIENLHEPDLSTAREVMVSALENAGVEAVSSVDIFNERGATSTEEDKANFLQTNFDAVLYFTVLKSGKFEQQIPNARFDFRDRMMHIGVFALPLKGDMFDLTDRYIVKPDGSVYEPIISLKAGAELQDTKTAKLVWKSETTSSRKAQDSNLASHLFGVPAPPDIIPLLRSAVGKIVERMRTDGAI